MLQIEPRAVHLGRQFNVSQHHLANSLHGSSQELLAFSNTAQLVGAAASLPASRWGAVPATWRAITATGGAVTARKGAAAIPADGAAAVVPAPGGTSTPTWWAAQTRGHTHSSERGKTGYEALSTATCSHPIMHALQLLRMH